MMTRRPPQLGRDVLNKIGQQLRSHYETRIFTSNPKLDALAMIADAKLRDDPYLKGATFKGRPI